MTILVSFVFLFLLCKNNNKHASAKRLIVSLRLTIVIQRIIMRFYPVGVGMHASAKRLIVSLRLTIVIQRYASHACKRFALDQALRACMVFRRETILVSYAQKAALKRTLKRKGGQPVSLLRILLAPSSSFVFT